MAVTKQPVSALMAHVAATSPSNPPDCERRSALGGLGRFGLAAASLGACTQALLSGCASRPVTISPSGPGADAKRGPTGGTPADKAPLPYSAAAEVAFLALSLVDTPYTYGGNSPAGGFDCSGLIVYAYRKAAGRLLPRTVAQLVRAGSQIDPEQVRTGDLVFFHTTGPYSHAGIYVGDDRFVHAPSQGGLVRLDGLKTAYWRPRYAQARRV